MPVTCHEVPRDGEGEPGPAIPGVGGDGQPRCLDAADYAERAARTLDAGVPVGDLDGTSRVVLVRGLAGDTGPRRFRVRCRVERKYRAEPEVDPGQKGDDPR